MITPARFRTIAILLSGVWLLIVYPLLNGYARSFLPREGVSNGADFSQYYSGALSVKIWQPDTLYPKPLPEVYQAPTQFRPKISNPWFTEKIASNLTGKTGDWSYYPQVASPSASNVSPELLKRCSRLQGDCRYIYPPPLALMLYPLAAFQYETACRIWFFLMSASLFGIGLISSLICLNLFGRCGWLAGAAILLPTLPTLFFSENSTALALGNVTPLLGLLIATCAYGFLTNRQPAIGLATIPLILFKGIGLAWCPLLLIGKKKWKTIIIMGILTALLNGLTLWFGGTEIYQVFFREILPKASLPIGTGLAGTIMSLFGINPQSTFQIISLLLVVWILWLHFRAIKAGAAQGISSLSSVIGMIAVFNLMNSVVWPHYFTSYLILTFSPWFAFEIMKLKGKARIAVTILFCSTMLCWLDTVLLSRDSWIVTILSKMNLYASWLDHIRMGFSALAVFLIPFLVTASTLFMAIRSLHHLRRDVRTHNPITSHEPRLASISPAP